jgi:hypothetical protein
MLSSESTFAGSLDYLHSYKRPKPESRSKSMKASCRRIRLRIAVTMFDTITLVFQNKINTFRFGGSNNYRPRLSTMMFSCLLILTTNISRLAPFHSRSHAWFMCCTHNYPVVHYNYEARGGVVIKALHFKPAGRGFGSRWCHWNFSVT